MALPTEVNISSHRPVVGKLIVAYKRLVKRIISPYLRSLFEERDRALDGRFAGITRDFLERTDALFSNLDQRIEALRAGRERTRVEFLSYLSSEEFTGQQKKALAGYFLTREDAVAADAAIKDLSREAGAAIKDLSREMTLHKRRLDVILGELRGKSAPESASVERIAFERARLDDHAYVSFENRFRGSRELIKGRMQAYVPLLTALSDRHKGCSILDVGCGRGELLELLKGAGVPATGVDLNEEMVEICRERGFDAETSEALSYLKGLEDGSLAGIVSCQFIEHLPTEALLEFVRLSLSKVRKGGMAVFETVNPESLSAMKSFYIDMTHVRPVHPQAISFAMESAGFSGIEIRHMSPFPEDERLAAKGDANMEKLNALLFGFQDYAVIGTK
ncbi:MAG: methyltransferase domain-containing protein [Deltaproteobacteria bacterium]|nr:methyltransferase domain-containing protein [Deltaproteobacteria bacterium]